MVTIDRKSRRLQSENISFDIWFIQIIFMLRGNNVSMQRRRLDFPIGLIYIHLFFWHKRINAGRQKGSWEGEAFTFIPWNPSFGWKLINSYHHKKIQLPHMNSVLWMKVNWFISSLNSQVLGWWGQRKSFAIKWPAEFSWLVCRVRIPQPSEAYLRTATVLDSNFGALSYKIKMAPSNPIVSLRGRTLNKAFN